MNGQSNELSGIEYHGVAGSTHDCVDAIERLVASGAAIKSALILSHFKEQEPAEHAILLTNVYDDPIAIKSGFGSGYGGAGPRWFSHVIGLLDWHGIEIEEIPITTDVLARLDNSALTMDDLDNLRSATPLRPTRFWEYVDDNDYPTPSKNPWRDRRAVLPWSLIDDRLADLARNFWDDPDAALSKGHRRLETIVRNRMGKDGFGLTGSQLFSRAFSGEKALLTWADLDGGERQGRANLFAGTAMAFRNPRAHREERQCSHEQLSEFLLLNLLFCLEASAVLTTG